MFFKKLVIMSTFPLIMTATGCSKDNKKAISSEPVLIGEYVASNDDYSTLNEALKVTQLSDLLLEKGNFTLFAPTNEAFEKINPLTLDLLFNEARQSEDGSGTLKNILLYHVVRGLGITSSDLTAADNSEGKSNQDEAYITPTTELGDALEIVNSGDEMLVNGMVGTSVIVESDIKSTNGVIQSIDALLNPTDSAFPSPAVTDESQSESSEQNTANEDGNNEAEDISQPDEADENADSADSTSPSPETTVVDESGEAAATNGDENASDEDSAVVNED